MGFAERLRELRTEKGMTLEEVGEHIGVCRANIYKYEHGIVKSVKPEYVHKLAKLFGVTRPYLMGWTDNRNVDPDENLDMVAKKQMTLAERWKPLKDTDCITAATQALRALIKFGIGRTPIYPQQILQKSVYATMITFQTDDRDDSVSPLEAISIYKNKDGSPHYLFSVNRDAPIGRLSLQLAVDLGHIYLGHSAESTEKDEREAECFSIHLLFPRPVIKLMEENGFVFTRESFSMIFGFCDWCLDSILEARPVSVSPELNRIVKEQFTPYVEDLKRYGFWNRSGDESEPIDLSKYMAGYEE